MVHCSIGPPVYWLVSDTPVKSVKTRVGVCVGVCECAYACVGLGIVHPYPPVRGYVVTPLYLTFLQQYLAITDVNGPLRPPHALVSMQ